MEIGPKALATDTAGSLGQEFWNAKPFVDGRKGSGGATPTGY